VPPPAGAPAGAQELKQAAKRVREARRRPAVTLPVADGAGAVADTPAPADGTTPVPASTVESLRQRVAELEAENAELRRELAALRGSPDAAQFGGT
jgi:uncharacterized protein YceH (UPF0502 family)